MNRCEMLSRVRDVRRPGIAWLLEAERSEFAVDMAPRGHDVLLLVRQNSERSTHSHAPYLVYGGGRSLWKRKTSMGELL
jgi:hypothetical protein